MDSKIYVGISGWKWLTESRLLTRHQHPLAYLAEHVDAVEIPDTFEEPLRPEVTRVWLRKLGGNEDLQFTAKLNRRFTHDRLLEPGAIEKFKEGLWPILRAGRMGCLLMQFPWSFRFTAENRDFLIRLRRTFHEFPLAAEMRHASWSMDEATGTFIDYKIAFCNLDQPQYTKAMPPTAFLTSSLGYVRLHGRNAFGWVGKSGRQHRYDYLYSEEELAEWHHRIGKIRGCATKLFVIANNDAGPKALVNALQLRSLLNGRDGRDVPAELLKLCPSRSQVPLFSGQAVA